VPEPVLRARGIDVAFGGVLAVDAVGVEVGRGEIVGVTGPRGSGKTTLLDALTGIVPARGELSVGGVRVRLGSPERARRAGLVRTHRTPRPVRALTSLENVLLATSDERHRGLLAAWLLRPLVERAEHERRLIARDALDRVGLGERPDRGSGTLTHGEQRLLDIARGIAARPRVLMLDEPGAGLNPRETDALSVLLRSVAADGVAVLVVDHRIDFVAALCDRITVLETGRVVAQGPPATVWRDRRVMDTYLGVAHDA